MAIDWPTLGFKGERLSSVFSPDRTLISASAAPHCGAMEVHSRCHKARSYQAWPGKKRKRQNQKCPSRRNMIPKADPQDRWELPLGWHRWWLWTGYEKTTSRVLLLKGLLLHNHSKPSVTALPPVRRRIPISSNAVTRVCIHRRRHRDSTLCLLGSKGTDCSVLWLSFLYRPGDWGAPLKRSNSGCSDYLRWPEVEDIAKKSVNFVFKPYFNAVPVSSNDRLRKVSSVGKISEAYTHIKACVKMNQNA